MSVASVGDIISAQGLIHNFVVDGRDLKNVSYAAIFDHGMVHENGN